MILSVELQDADFHVSPQHPSRSRTSNTLRSPLACTLTMYAYTSAMTPATTPSRAIHLTDPPQTISKSTSLPLASSSLLVANAYARNFLDTSTLTRTLTLQLGLMPATPSQGTRNTTDANDSDSDLKLKLKLVHVYVSLSHLPPIISLCSCILHDTSHHTISSTPLPVTNRSRTHNASSHRSCVVHT